MTGERIEAAGWLGTEAAIGDGQQLLTGTALRGVVQQFADALAAAGVRVLATLLDNAPAWVLADLAAAEAGVVHVPLPAFFTREQVAHALAAAGADTLLAAPARAEGWPQARRRDVALAGARLAWIHLATAPQPLPAGTAKITFTSGTTGTPKGVCLRQDAMLGVACGLVAALEPLAIRRHLCVLPLPVLLENIAGVLAPLVRGATCIVPPLRDVGVSGSSSFDVARFHAAVSAHAPHSLILLPQMLRAWAGWLHATGARAPDSLRLVAVGGAAVGEPLLQLARSRGIPAYEGYGLSEGASVQTLNLPGADRPGSAGRPLPHARVRVAADGELEIAGTLLAGYLGDPAPPPAWWPTGDLGRIDDDGFVHVQGRKRDVLITGFGRNVSPEWVETALRGEGAIAQAVVFGEGEPALSAVVWPVVESTSDTQLQAAIAAANARLPDYAAVRHWVRARAPFTAQSGLATANGRPRRDAIRQAHAGALAAHRITP